MKVKALVLAVVALLPVAASAHQAGDFFMRAGSATVRPTGGWITCLASENSTSVIIPSLV